MMGCMAEPDPLLEALRTLTGRADAEFRDGQREAISALVDDRGRVLVVQRTGWGKSAVYFLTTHLLRAQGAGPTLLISPLLALMRNQIDAARRLGLRCETINSASATTVAELERQLRADEVDLLLISPERLANPGFGNKIMPIVGARPGLIVIDEVHCISDWGHDFRPDYRRIGRIVDRLAGSSVPILGCTATANDRVVNDVADQLGAELTTFRGPLRREGLALSTIRLDRQAERLAWLAETLPELEGSGIVYCLTVRDVENVAAWLTSQGLEVEAYFGSLDNEARVEAERRLQTNEIKALVATTALGMGYDKPDLSFVVHFQSPGSPVAYYQQVGRAGRALETSRGILLRGQEDEQIQDWFIEQAFAEEHLVNDIVNAFDSFDGPVPLMRIQVKLNVKIGTLELVVKQLDVDGVLERVAGTSYQRTLAPWTYPASRVEAVTMERRLEQQAMVDYFHTTGCRMKFIANLLDDPAADDCGICDNCTSDTGVRRPSVEATAAAERFLLTRPIEINPKKMHLDADTGGRRKIPTEEQTSSGRALAMWGDAGWGRRASRRGARRTRRRLGARSRPRMGHRGAVDPPPRARPRVRRTTRPPARPAVPPGARTHRRAAHPEGAAELGPPASERAGCVRRHRSGRRRAGPARRRPRRLGLDHHRSRATPAACRCAARPPGRTVVDVLMPRS
jgi:ATP-dependent DNA helicase RecQ